MTRQCSPATTRQQLEAIGQTVQDLFRSQDARSYGRELDCQRHAIELSTDLDDGSLVRGGQLESPRSRVGALGKQHDRFDLSKPIERLTEVG